MNLFKHKSDPEIKKTIENQQSISDDTLSYVKRVLDKKDQLIEDYETAEKQRLKRSRGKS